VEAENGIKIVFKTKGRVFRIIPGSCPVKPQFAVESINLISAKLDQGRCQCDLSHLQIFPKHC
jgi:hypothetical protein